MHMCGDDFAALEARIGAESAATNTTPAREAGRDKKSRRHRGACGRS